MSKKLSQSMNTLDLNHGNIEKKANRALRQIELNYHEDKYDEILRLQQENNKLLKSLREKEQANHSKPKKGDKPKKRTNSYSGVAEKDSKSK